MVDTLKEWDTNTSFWFVIKIIVLLLISKISIIKSILCVHSKWDII